MSLSSITLPDGKRYLPKVVVPPPASSLYRIRWDEELAEYGFKSRTLEPGFPWVQTPAVQRFYPTPQEGSGDFRIHIASLRPALLALNGGDDHKIVYWSQRNTGQFNNTGWDAMAYIATAGNFLRGLREVAGMLEFETLTLASDFTTTDTAFVHTFGIVGHNPQTLESYHTTNSPQGVIRYFLITKEGKAYIPMRLLEKVS